MASVATPEVSATVGKGSDATGSDASGATASALSSPRPKSSVVSTPAVSSTCLDGDDGGAG